jgi:hypothetical protein
MARGRVLGMSLAGIVALAGCDAKDAKDGPATLGSARATTAAAASPPRVLLADAGHDAMARKEADPYVIPPSAAVVIDLGDRRFVTRDGGSAVPDAVHVVHGSTGYHRATFTGTRATLDAASLDAVKGGPFAGFEAGESYMVAIGTEAPSPEGAMRFVPLWSATIKVSAR